VIKALIRALTASSSSWPADEKWTIAFFADVDGMRQPVYVHGVTHEEAAEIRRHWLARRPGRLTFTFRDEAGMDDETLALFAQGWPRDEVFNLHIMPMREAL
jgi:hypothetical protein